MFENLGLYLLVSTTVTRIGAVLLLIFGAKVLINFYRYNLRLAAFYDARADAIELLGNDPMESLPALVTSLSAEHIDMGKPPKTPSQEVVELAEAVASIRKQNA